MAETQTDIAEYQTDHDLLVVLNERVLILTKAVEKKSDDHEIRLRDVEKSTDDLLSSSQTWRYIVGIALPVMLTMVGWLFLQVYTIQSTIDSRISKAITTQLTNYQLIKNK